MEEKQTKINRDFSGEIRVCASVDNEFTYSEYLADIFAHAKSDKIGQTYDRTFSFINELFIINYTTNVYKDLKVKFVFQHEAFKMPLITVTGEIDENYEIGLNIPDLIVDYNFFYTFNEAIPSSFDVVLK